LAAHVVWGAHSDQAARRFGVHPNARLDVRPERCTTRSCQAAHVKRCLVLVLPLLEGCIYVPRSATIYDEDCKTSARHMTLQATQLGAFSTCANQGCVALLIGAGAVTAASAVVSGSIVVVGNVAYWIEKQGNCSS